MNCLRATALVPGLGLLLLIGGCAARSDYPSLAPRGIEKALDEGAAPPPVAAAPVGADAAVVAKIDAVLVAAATGDAGFRAELAKARGALARADGAAQGSDAWIDAQQAYSILDAARGPVAVAMSDLDSLEREQLGTANAATLAAIDSGHRTLLAIAAGQDEALAQLGRQLR